MQATRQPVVEVLVVIPKISVVIQKIVILFAELMPSGFGGNLQIREDMVYVSKFRNVTTQSLVRGRGATDHGLLAPARALIFVALLAAVAAGGYWVFNQVRDRVDADTPFTAPGPATGGPAPGAPQTSPQFPGVIAQRGDSGPIVEDIQRFLRDRWGYVVSVDGQFGPGTESVVKEFQTARGLPATGRVDIATYEELASGEVPMTSNSNQPPTTSAGTTTSTDPGPALVEVPGLLQLTEQEARVKLNEAGLKMLIVYVDVAPDSSEIGRVVGQDIDEHVPVEVGSAVEVQIGRAAVPIAGNPIG